MNGWPKITVVTPNYNLGKWLEKTIQSVIGQNYPNLEYIIIDGGSTDNSLEIIKKYEKKLSFWISEPDKGMYDAIAKGFKKSTGEIMMWLNSDDVLHPNSLFTVGQIFRDLEKVEWLTARPSLIDAKGRTVDVLPLKRWSKYMFLNKEYKWISQESTAWRRSLWERSGGKFGNGVTIAGDFELWLRFFDYAKIHMINGLIGGFRKHQDGQLSDNMDKYITEVEKCLNDKYNLLSPEESHKMNIFRRNAEVKKIFSRLPISIPQKLALRLYDHSFFEYGGLIWYDPMGDRFIIKNNPAEWEYTTC